MSQRQPSENDRRPLHVTNRTAADPPEAADGPFAVERLEVLTHELGNLLDGSMRCLGLAKRLVPKPGEEGDGLEPLRKQLETAYVAMERMADLVHAAMRGSASVVGSATMLPERPITLAEAVEHAAEVMRPLADESRTVVHVSMAEGAAAVPAGPIYSVVLNGVRNAIESIGRCGGGGRVDVSVEVRGDEGGGPVVVLEIADDGRGVKQEMAGRRAMRVGSTSKPGGLGIGLALAAEVVRELGGTIQLRRRPERSGDARPGAVLSVIYPPPKDRGQRKVG